MSDRIPILTDDGPATPGLGGRGMFPGGPAAELLGGVPRLTEVALETVQAGIRSVLAKTARAVGDAALDGTAWQVAEVKLGLAIDGNGQVSLLSVAKGQIGARVALDVTLRLPQPPKGS